MTLIDLWARYLALSSDEKIDQILGDLMAMAVDLDTSLTSLRVATMVEDWAEDMVHCLEDNPFPTDQT
jgi:hypothetical protein